MKKTIKSFKLNKATVSNLNPKAHHALKGGSVLDWTIILCTIRGCEEDEVTRLN